MIIVTGTGRCGTGYWSKVLTSAGIHCGHEAVFTPFGPVLSTAQADASWMAAPFLRYHRDARVLHLTRHPKDVIESKLSRKFCQPGKYFEFFKQHFNQVSERRDRQDVQSTEDLMALLWCVWNDLCMRATYHCNEYLLHKVTEDRGIACEFLGIPAETAFDDRKYNSSPRTVSVTWDSFSKPIRRKLEKTMEDYGYEWEAEDAVS